MLRRVLFHISGWAIYCAVLVIASALNQSGLAYALFMAVFVIFYFLLVPMLIVLAIMLVFWLGKSVWTRKLGRFPEIGVHLALLSCAVLLVMWMSETYSLNVSA